MKRIRLPDVLVVVAIVGVIFGLIAVVVQTTRNTAHRKETCNNLHQLGIASHLYHVDNEQFPAGNTKDNNRSAFVALLNYLGCSHEFVGESHVPLVLTYLDPRDSVPPVKGTIAGSNFLFCAGSEPGLEKNNGVCYQDSAVSQNDIVEGNGLANTILIGTTLRGNVGTLNVQRQHIALTAKALKDIDGSSGVQDFKDGKNVVGDRCSNWFQGRFLQGTFTATRGIDDPAPDVDCGEFGGLSALRSLDGKVPILYCDAHVSTITNKVSLEMLKMMASRLNKQSFEAP